MVLFTQNMKNVKYHKILNVASPIVSSVQWDRIALDVKMIAITDPVVMCPENA